MTPAELRAAAAQELGLLVAGGAPLSPEDDAKLVTKYRGLHAQLLEHELVTWALAENIPAKCEQPMTWLLAATAVNISGHGAARRAEILLLGALDASPISLAERQLRKAIAGKTVITPATPDYF